MWRSLLFHLLFLATRSTVSRLLIRLNCILLCLKNSSQIAKRSLKIRYHVPSTVGPGKESLTSNLRSQQLDRQLDHVTALGSSFISCTTLDKTLGVRTPVTLIAEFPWVVTPEACLGKLFLVEKMFIKGVIITVRS